MRKVPLTITLPENVVRDMRSYVSQRQISNFISELVQQEISKKKEILAKAFEELAKDEHANEEAKLWDTTIGDGLDETNEY